MVVNLPKASGGEFQWQIASPQRLVQRAVRDSPGFKQLLQRAMDTRPSTLEAPWRIAFYHDEITPGNPLRPENKRKTIAFFSHFSRLAGR